MRLLRFLHSTSTSNSRSLSHPHRTAHKPNAAPPPPPAAGPTYDPHVIHCNKAIARLMRWGDVSHAQKLFDEMPVRTVSSYNTMLAGYISNSLYSHAISLFSAMSSPDTISHNTMLSCHARRGDLRAARKVFDEMPVKDGISYNTLISAYARHGQVDRAKELFDQTPIRDEISWNGILAAYVRNGRFELAEELFRSNPNWDVISWNVMIAAYVQRRQLGNARKLFDEMPNRDNVSWNSMISGYARNNNMVEARKLFDVMPVEEKDVFTWTAVVSGYAGDGNLEEAKRTFERMPERNVVSWNAMVAAYVRNGRFDDAKDLFDQMPCRDEVTWNTMLTAYANAGMIKEARDMFDKMPHRNQVSWSAMLTAYTQVGLSEEALRLFIEMFKRGTKPNRSSFACVLISCADMATLQCAIQLHAQLIKSGYGMGCFVGNALIALYFKCGSVEDARTGFDEMHERDTASWNTMISGYARHGFGLKAWEIFELMKQSQTRPDDITMIGVLSACSHTGLVDEGISLFHTMERVYNITPKPSHYTCMIDILGRAGRLKEAQSLIQEMIFDPDPSTWGALLAASRVHREPEIGKWAAEKVLMLEPHNSGMYVLLSNIYASYGKWNYVHKTRNLMGENRVAKVPGFSWIEVNNKVHTFSVGDIIHPEKDKIYKFLEELDTKLKKAGYVSATEIVLHDIEEEDKVHMLKYHSERLAVAFGILNVPLGRPIRVLKNLRICEDCHNAIKYISKVENRVIILRDSNRFHHFSNGSCSCGDYW